MPTHTPIASAFHRSPTTLDLPMLRLELESASALALQDLTHELCCQREELPGLQFWEHGRLPNDWQVARLMATCFEAGRRYGLLSAIELVSPDIIPAHDSGVTHSQRKYATTRTIEEADHVNGIRYHTYAALMTQIRLLDQSTPTEDRLGRALTRLQIEQPLIYELLWEDTETQSAALRAAEAERPCTGHRVRGNVK